MFLPQSWERNIIIASYIDERVTKITYVCYCLHSYLLYVVLCFFPVRLSTDINYRYKDD